MERSSSLIPHYPTKLLQVPYWVLKLRSTPLTEFMMVITALQVASSEQSCRSVLLTRKRVVFVTAYTLLVTTFHACTCCPSQRPYPASGATSLIFMFDCEILYKQLYCVVDALRPAFPAEAALRHSGFSTEITIPAATSPNVATGPSPHTTP